MSEAAGAAERSERSERSEAAGAAEVTGSGGPPRLVLIGAPGAGKTTVGRIVAGRLGVGFRDTDADVAAAAGKPVSAIFVDDGEAVFRALEATAVAEALRAHGGVLALGGGAVLTQATQEALRGHRVIFLDVVLSTAARRVGLNRDRPLLLNNPRATLKALLDARRPIYRAMATKVVAADGRVNEVVARVLEVLADGDARSERSEAGA
jgi:shikimate kinase